MKWKQVTKAQAEKHFLRNCHRNCFLRLNPEGAEVRTIEQAAQLYGKIYGEKYEQQFRKIFQLPPYRKEQPGQPDDNAGSS